MADNITPAPTEPTAAQTGNLAPAGQLSAQQVAGMRATWVAQGLDPTAFDAAAAGTTLAETSAEPQAIEALNDLKQPALSVDQAREMAQALLDAGVSPEAVNAALAADGYGQETPDTRTDEQREFDRAFGPEHPAPEAYKIQWRDIINPAAGPEVLAEANAQATGWLSEVGLDPSIGAHVVETAYRAGEAYGGMSEGEQSLYKAEQNALFVRLAGSSEEAQRLMRCAAYAANRGNRAFRDRLYDSGALHSAEIIMHLARHGERLVARHHMGAA